MNIIVRLNSNDGLRLFVIQLIQISHNTGNDIEIQQLF